jgi:hypothetical protein
VDMRSGRVLEASTTLLVPVADRFVCGLLEGRTLPAQSAGFVEDVTERYHGNAKRAVIAAYRDLVQKYQDLVTASEGLRHLDHPSARGEKR